MTHRSGISLWRWLRNLSFAAVFALDVAVVQADVTTLPGYEAEIEVSGVLRSWGPPAAAKLLQNWQAEFRTYHPNVYFTNKLTGSSSAIMGLEEYVADMAVMGRQIVPYDTYGIWRRSHLLPVEIEVATGSYNVTGKSAAIAVFVHRDNPITQLTLEQLDGIFGAQRTGGWQGMEWAPESARGANKNIRTWGQLGLKGEWANAPIQPFGPPGLYPGGMSYFQIRVLQGADTWNEKLLEYADRRAMIEALERDRYAIAYANVSHGTNLVKTVAISESIDSQYVMPTRESVANRSYPLTRPLYVYFAPDFPNGDAREKMDPTLKEFLRYVLSRQGQEQVAREGDYLPLTDSVLRSQRRKLDEPPAKFKRVSP